MPGLDFLQDLAIVMVVAGIAGWICQRIGLSSVVGFLLAGIIIGPSTPPFALISDLDRIHTLSQLGLVFLMFSIGMGLSLRRFHQMGAPILLATAIGALLVLAAGRTTGLLIGWTSTQTLFFAALLMTSSSAIISKVLHEIGATHEPASRRAMIITVAEDVVAVVMLTVLTTLSAGGGQDGPSIAETIGLIVLFVTVLVIAGLLIVPKLLERLARTADVDLQTILVAGMVLATSLLAVRAGYSLALGAFLLGVIVAVTPQRSHVERHLQGLRDIFSAVFFVSIGLLMNVQSIAASWLLVLLLGIFTVILRTLVCSTALVLTGLPTRDAIRTGLMVTPIGEFSFIIAQLGVTSHAAPPLIYPLAVGISLFTALTAPILIKHSDRLSRAIERAEPKFLKELIQLYHGALERIRQRHEGNAVWQLTKRRLRQVGLGFLFVTGLLAFSRTIYSALFGAFGAQLLLPYAWKIGYWVVLGLVALAPLFAVWRNLAALAAIYAEALTKDASAGGTMRGVMQAGLQTTFTFLMMIWLWLLLPLERATVWTVAAVVILFSILLLLLRRKLTILHSKVEIELNSLLSLSAGEDGAARSYQDLLLPHKEWDIHVHEVILPDAAACAGKTLSDLELRRKFGCSVAGVERHGFAIPNPSPDLVLYPGDKLLLLATEQQISAARKVLSQTHPANQQTQLIEEVELQGIVVPGGSRAAGKLLIELEIPSTTGVQVVGIARAGNRLLNPGPFQAIEAGDRLLALGTSGQIANFERWLRSPEQ
jgi:CPA2 family monovalent cation:H+ antiporter-2